MEFSAIKNQDMEVYNAIHAELDRQRNHIELIASENFVSPAVMEALGSPLTNKYAEGLPGKRFYGGCEYVDIVEDLARERAKALFGAEHANVQPHSGAQANMAVCFAVLQPGDTILGLELPTGGHLSHGSKANLSGKYFNAVSYGVNEQELLDYDEIERLAVEHQPKLIIAGASAYAREIDFKRFSEIAKKVGAYLMVDIAHICGLVVAGQHPSPVPYADFITTTTHKTLRGPRGGLILCKAEHAAKIDKAVFPGIQGGPLMHTIAAKAICFKEAMSDDFREYQKQIKRNANAMAERLKAHGLRLVSGGTDNHLMLVDVHAAGKNGKEIQELLDRAYITANKNTIPHDPLGPGVTSGVRLGTPAMTSRGMKEPQAELIADLIAKLIYEGEAAVAECSEKVAELCREFPLYPDGYHIAKQ